MTMVKHLRRLLMKKTASAVEDIEVGNVAEDV